MPYQDYENDSTYVGEPVYINIGGLKPEQCMGAPRKNARSSDARYPEAPPSRNLGRPSAARRYPEAPPPHRDSRDRGDLLDDPGAAGTPCLINVGGVNPNGATRGRGRAGAGSSTGRGSGGYRGGGRSYDEWGAQDDFYRGNLPPRRRPESSYDSYGGVGHQTPINVGGVHGHGW
eukprot:TRINITY_DN76579_c0_g1_i1.p1 TRINITY_DN76579_c0_g1~~TRINITY_DN76579_c0_g1_i1.p1  ORF type:complete len:175 (-),score=15.15 TRINITY_DN76579_c0_g1_i1:397-921(-)